MLEKSRIFPIINSEHDWVQRRFLTKDKYMTGIVKRVVSDKGFGFISDFEGREYFFHRSEININWDGVFEGQKVSFVEVHSPKGPRAEKVKLVGGDRGE